MKKTFLAMLMAGCSLVMFAQTTPTTPTTPPTTPATPTTTQPTTTTEPVPLNSNTNNTITTTTSTSWSPTATPYWGWNSYGLWNMSMYPPTTSSDVVVNSDGSLTSAGAYSAYGTPVPALPSNVQMRFNTDFPTTASGTQSWNQYGDWFHTHYINSGRSMHYFYNARGDGYALALPVIQSYVPEDIIDKALQKYGANLYSVSTVQTSDGDAYKLGIIEQGQLRTDYLNEDGSSVVNIWRVEELNTTDANAAMAPGADMSTATSTDDSEKETKIKWKENGVKTKIKAGDGKVKIKQKKIDD